ncbi:MAG: Holliday junction resolvase-like protein [Bacillota bacterium]
MDWFGRWLGTTELVVTVLGFLVLVLAVLYVVMRLRAAELATSLAVLQRQFQARVEEQRRTLEEQYRVALESWKREVEGSIRQDAVEKSRAVTAGKVREHLVPYLPGFPYNPRDVRFIGSPVDLVVFDGLDEGTVRRVVFVEVKTGRSELSHRERLVREAVLRQAVGWEELRLPEGRSHKSPPEGRQRESPPEGGPHESLAEGRQEETWHE